MFYKFKEGNWQNAIKIEFPDGTILDQNNKISKDGWVWLDASPIANESLLSDISFGKALVNTYLQDNRSYGNMTNSESLVQLQKFSTVKALAEVGNLINVLEILKIIEVDAIFTQERKDKYIKMCNDYLKS